MRESKIEKYLRTEIAKLGGYAEKHVSPGVRGMPDQLVLWAKQSAPAMAMDYWGDPCVEFIETKAPNGKLSVLQQRDHKRRREMGFQVHVIWNMEQAETYLRSRGKEMSITDRMENEGMTFQDAVDKEAGVSGTPQPGNDITYIKARLQEIIDRDPHSKLLRSEAGMILEFIEAQDKRFADHLAAWKANNESHAKQIEELEGRIKKLEPPRFTPEEVAAANAFTKAAFKP